MKNLAKAQLLREAVQALQTANNLQQQALDGSDMSYDVHNSIEDLVMQLEELAEDLT